VHVCVHGLWPTGRRTDGAGAAVRRRRTLHMLNYMLLTVVANRHNCVATATAGYAQGRFQDFTLVATEAECQSIFSHKVDDLFSRRLQNFTVLNKAGRTSQQSQFFCKKIHSIDGWGTWPP